jgi:hypothetical protein
VVLVDYRSFGKSTGKRSEQRMLADMQFVYETLAVNYPEDYLFVYGRCLGSGFATKIASYNKPRYLILDAPYYNFKKEAERLLTIFPTAGCCATTCVPIAGYLMYSAITTSSRARLIGSYPSATARPCAKKIRSASASSAFMMAGTIICRLSPSTTISSAIYIAVLMW